MRITFFDKFQDNPLWHNDSDMECFLAKPLIWLYGIEAGGTDSKEPHPTYDIDLQLSWKFNSNAFRLFSAILESDEVLAKDHVRFARKYQPFVRGQNAFYKGNLFSLACKEVKTWTNQDIEETGCTKEEYMEKSRLFFSEAHKMIQQASPKLFIATGLSHCRDFSKLVFGQNTVELQEKIFNFPVSKRIVYNIQTETKFFVIPHLSSRYKTGLKIESEIFEVGRFIRSLLPINELFEALEEKTK